MKHPRTIEFNYVKILAILYNYPPKGWWIYTETRSVEVYIQRSSPTLWGIVVLVFTKSDGLKNAVLISSSETFAKRRAIFLSVRKTVNSQLRIFQVTGANQNARKLLSTDLVNTSYCYMQFCSCQME